MSFKTVLSYTTISYVTFIIGQLMQAEVDYLFIGPFGIALYLSATLAFITLQKSFESIKKEKVMSQYFPIFLAYFIVLCTVSYLIL